MGLGLKITYKKEEINLTDFTIENHVRKVEDIPGRNEFLARNVNSLEINGKYSIFDASKESLEVNKLACWYKVTAHEESCYRKLEFILRDNNDEEYDSLTFEKAFMVDYSEVFNFERSTIDFYALIREFKEEILEADGKNILMDRLTSTTTAMTEETEIEDSKEEDNIIVGVKSFAMFSYWEIENITLKGDVPLRYNGVTCIADSKIAAVFNTLIVKVRLSYEIEKSDSVSVEFQLYGKTYTSNSVNIAKDKSGSTYTFTIKDLNRGFSKEDVILKWRLNKGKEILREPITIYFLPNKPNLPWVTNIEDDYQNPWTIALDMLLNWGVRGFSDTTTISTKITEYVFNNNRFKYDIKNGASSYAPQDAFDCTSFITKINDKGEIMVNCTDCATIVSTFSNLLGANLYQVQFGGYGFLCNKVKIIGYDSIWQYPFPNGKDFYDTTATRGGFKYHEVAFNGNYSYEDKIYDACLKVNSYALNPMRSASERLPLNLQFALYDPYTSQISGGDIDRIKYREMLLLNNINNLNNGAIIGSSARRRKIE